MSRINSELTFGLEMECVRTTPSIRNLAERRGFQLCLDHSIRGDNDEVLPRSWPGAGTEIVTPILDAAVTGSSDGATIRIGMGNSLDVITDMCNCAAHVNKSCGIHVHVGKPSKTDPHMSVWKPDEVRLMLLIGRHLEGTLFGLVKPSRVNNPQCTKIEDRFTPADFGNFYPTGRVHAVKYQNPKRYCWLNLIETRRVGNTTELGHGGSPAKGTVEIRMLGETRDPNYIFLWTHLWLKIAAYVAYVNPTMAMAQCCFAGKLNDDIAAVKNAFEKEQSSTPREWPRQDDPLWPSQTVVGDSTLRGIDVAIPGTDAATMGSAYTSGYVSSRPSNNSNVQFIPEDDGPAMVALHDGISPVRPVRRRRPTTGTNNHIA